MRTVSVVFGIVSLCIGWLPVVGWLGAALGVAACFLGILSAGSREKAGYVAWGIITLALGITSTALALAYQVKHAGGEMDPLVVHLPLTEAVFAMLFGALVAVLGIALARRRSRLAGLSLAGLAVFALCLAGAWALTTADREMETAPAMQSGDSSS